MLTPEMKTLKNNLVESLASITSLKKQKETLAIPMDLLNESFYKLPEDIQLKILNIGHEIDDLLRQLKASLNNYTLYEHMMY